MTKKQTTVAAAEVTRSRRPRAGTWTPFPKQVPIPGCDDTADLDMYRVEFTDDEVGALALAMLKAADGEPAERE